MQLELDDRVNDNSTILREKVIDLAADLSFTIASKLAFGFTAGDLYQREALVRLDGEFLKMLADADLPLTQGLDAARQDASRITAKAESELLLALAPHLDRFIAGLFGIEPALGALSARHHELAPLYQVKRLFVQRKAMHRVKPEEARSSTAPRWSASWQRPSASHSPNSPSRAT